MIRRAGPGDATGSGPESRILDAALASVARWGLAKTTLSDIAAEAGCSRATIYRCFPGGKDHLFASLGSRELAGFLTRVGAMIDETDNLEDALVVGTVEAARFLAGHDALQFLLRHEPGIVLPYLGFRQVDRLYRAAAVYAGPHLSRHLDPDQAAWAAEWIGRIVLSYLFNPAADVDLTDEPAVRRLVRRFLLPALQTGPAPPALIDLTADHHFIAAPEPALSRSRS